MTTTQQFKNDLARYLREYITEYFAPTPIDQRATEAYVDRENFRKKFEGDMHEKGLTPILRIVTADAIGDTRYKVLTYYGELPEEDYVTEAHVIGMAAKRGALRASVANVVHNSQDEWAHAINAIQKALN